MPEALPAITVLSLSKAGLSFAIQSRVASWDDLIGELAGLLGSFRVLAAECEVVVLLAGQLHLRAIERKLSSVGANLLSNAL